MSDDNNVYKCFAKVSSIAYDWLSHNLYWSDVAEKLICALSFIDGANYKADWKPVINTNLSAPQGLAVDPLRT
jgi:hypothetical protein